MPVFKVACNWTMYGEFDVEADTIDQAIALVEAGREPYNGVPTDDEYVDGSFEINAEVTKELNGPKV